VPWGRVRVGVKAVLNFCENRLFLNVLKQQEIRTRKRRKEQTSGASALDPHLHPPPRHGGRK
jgi:hypothetical protein